MAEIVELVPRASSLAPGHGKKRGPADEVGDHVAGEKRAEKSYTRTI